MNFSNSIPPMDYFEKLPEGCIFEIISRTTSAEAVKSMILSKECKFVVESYDIWEKFLPSDYQEIINRSEFPPVCNTKRELFFSLCDSPILVDGGKLSFYLDKHSGKKCFMIAPRDLIIAGSDHIEFWQWYKHPNSRFSEVAQLRSTTWLQIQGKIKNRILSKETKYIGYLIFKLVEDASFRLHNTDSEVITFIFCDQSVIEIHSGQESSKRLSSIRGDGWMEIELGKFDRAEYGDVDVGLMEVSSSIKSGLIIEGIEFRPE